MATMSSHTSRLDSGTLSITASVAIAVANAPKNQRTFGVSSRGQFRSTGRGAVAGGPPAVSTGGSLSLCFDDMEGGFGFPLGGDPEDLLRGLREFAEQQAESVQDAQREQFATLTLNTAVELTGAALSQMQEIGRASCRERVAVSVDAGCERHGE